ncbi:DUF4398 domain-containing protein [Leptospira sp. GIMC2001]|uniref:DUF4398 domain-containing protein n=1 Tax=Leptospira sp. GIMC2001 TaxID=1513297 RepID=UPI00234B5185|nr:DUF4398 domain-containing protein [Leptospira sp. GIMC2001]WCL48643.1 DUF4398 domain-containing protein [Leptospira sp. GIMC2001]
MKPNHKYSRILLSVATLAFAYSCASELPIQEMSNARQAIARAESLQATEYAPDELKESKDALFEAHENASEEKASDAKKRADYSISKANDALEKTLPRLSAKTRDEATEAIDQADKAFATGLAPDDFDRSVQLRKEGDQAMEAGDASLSSFLQEKDETKKSELRNKSFDEYEDAHNKYLASKTSANKAREVALSNKDELRQSARYVEEDLNTTETYIGGMNDKTRAERENLASAYQDIDNDELKSANDKISASRKNSRALLAASIQNYARERNLTATEVVEDANSRFEEIKEDSVSKDANQKSNYESARENLGAANESLASAGNLYSQEKYEDSIRQSEEAIRLGQIVTEQTASLSATSVANRSATNSDDKMKTSATDSKNDGKDSNKDGKLKEGWSKYVVRKQQPEDCLWRIAGNKNSYGNPKLWPRIYQANKNKIKNKNLIYPNQVLYIPPKTGEIGSPYKTETDTPVNGSEEVEEEPTEMKKESGDSTSGDGKKVDSIVKPVNGPDDEMPSEETNTGNEEEILEEE